MQSVRFILLAVVSFFGVSLTVGFAQDEIPAIQVTDDVVYGHKDGLALTLDVLQPAQNRNGLGLILVSSGSWISRKSDVPQDQPRSAARVQEFVKSGYTLFIVRHGSSPRYHVPEMTADMNRAVRFVRSIAKRFEVDPNHLGITGFSSGGHLSLMAALTGDDGHPDSKDPVERLSSRVQCVMAWFPPTDLLNYGVENSYLKVDAEHSQRMKRILGDTSDMEPKLRSISPVYLVKQDAPPLLLIHGDADKTVPLQQSEVLKSKYEELGLTVKLVIQPGGGHGPWPGMSDHFILAREWFDKYLKM